MINKDFFAAVDELANEKGISSDFIMEQFSIAVCKVLKKHDQETLKKAQMARQAELRRKAIERARIAEANGEELPEETEEERLEDEEEQREITESENIFCDMNREKCEIKTYRKMTIVEEVTNSVTELTVDQAKNYTKRHVKVGDTVNVDIKLKDISRILAANVKQIFKQAELEEEKRRKAKDIAEKDREVVTATVIHVNPETLDSSIQIGKDLFLFPRDDQLPNETLKDGQKIKVYVSIVPNPDPLKSETTFANLSRREPGLVKRLFEMEVPEIADGTVEVISIAREPGSRTKIAVYAKDENVDPVGACIGQQGIRINAITSELDKEKIDIVRFNPDPEKFITAALSPAKVTSVDIDQDSIGQKKAVYHVTVPNDQLSLAIGNKGQNVRLAARLTGYKIDIGSDQKA